MPIQISDLAHTSLGNWLKCHLISSNLVHLYYSTVVFTEIGYTVKKNIGTDTIIADNLTANPFPDHCARRGSPIKPVLAQL